MKYLFDHSEALESALAGKRLLLMLDFDGTLSPIAPTPGEAVFPRDTRRELERIAKSPACAVAVISGRELGDVRARVGIPGITYVGNHGLEVARPNEEPQHVRLPWLEAVLRQMREELASKLAPFAGAIVEDKTYALAVHYRGVSERDRPLVKEAVRETVRAFGNGRNIEMSPGAMVVDLRPSIGCDKGTIVSGFLESDARRDDHAQTLAIYVGDDATDEDAFRAIRGRGWGILVGPPRISYAEYYLRNLDEVRALLHLLAERCEEMT